MPTVPVHQGCAASQAITSSASSCSCLQVLVPHEAVGIAVAAHVDAHAGIAVAGDVGVGEGVAPSRAVALAVGQVFQDRRHRLRFGILGQPDAGRQPAAVGERDPGVLDLADRAREVGDGAERLEAHHTYLRKEAKPLGRKRMTPIRSAP